MVANEEKRKVKLIFPCNVKPDKIGLEIHENDVTFTFPVNYYQNNSIKEIECNSLNEINKEYSNSIVTLTKLLSKYKESKDIEDYFNNENKFPIEAYLWIFRDYLKNGIYKDSENYYCVNGNGKINWKNTIKKGKTFLGTDNLVYKDIIKKNTRYNVVNQITEIHRICVQKAIYIIGPFYGISSKKIKTKITEEIKNSWVGILKKELLISYNDYKIELLRKLIYLLQSQDINKFNSCEFNLVTKDYNYIFERLIDEKFGNVNSSDYNPQGEIHLSENKKAISAGQLRPDSINVDNEGIYIFDSKYYTYSFFENGTLPDVSSINKQITYAQYINNPLNNLNPENKKIYNIFILPKNDDYIDTNKIVKEKFRSDLSYIGYSNIKNNNQNSYDNIYMFLINFRKLVENKIDEKCFNEIKRIIRLEGLEKNKK